MKKALTGHAEDQDAKIADLTKRLKSLERQVNLLKQEVQLLKQGPTRQQILEAGGVIAGSRSGPWPKPTVG